MERTEPARSVRFRAIFVTKAFAEPVSQLQFVRPRFWRFTGLRGAGLVTSCMPSLRPLNSAAKTNANLPLYASAFLPASRTEKALSHVRGLRIKSGTGAVHVRAPDLICFDLILILIDVTRG
jgi:hypothetical protein